MDKEDKNTSQVKPLWFIDLDWYRQNNRSFTSLAQGCLCPKCQKQLKKEISASDLLTTIKDCCSKTPDFITGKLPVLESTFRFFLTNGNQPLDLEELGTRLSEWRKGDTYRTSIEVLPRLLSSDQYYGLRQIP
ncbi:hypothetical protein ACFLWD_01790 [Chloroflexota bacterium]